MRSTFSRLVSLAALCAVAAFFSLVPARGVTAPSRVADPISSGQILEVTSAVAGDMYQMSFSTSTEGIWQAEITGTATVILKGRINPAAPWVTLATRTSSGGDIVPIFPEMQAECTSYTSGNVNVWVASKTY